jgi:RimJ/RimL family protein N-acetyltransferase
MTTASKFGFLMNINQMWLGVLNTSVAEEPTFLVIDSAFSDPWYNFVVPTVELADFDWQAAQQVMQEKQASGKRFSYYIQTGLSSGAYQQLLETEGYSQIGDDTYMVKSLKRVDMPAANTSILEYKSALESPEVYKRLAVEAFPEWDNAAQFSQHLLDKEQTEQATKVRNYIAFKEGTAVGICAMVFNDNLGYMTNTGIKEDFRGQHLQQDMISFREQRLLKDFGVHTAVAILEHGKASWKNYVNADYTEWKQFAIFTRS